METRRHAQSMPPVTHQTETLSTEQNKKKKKKKKKWERKEKESYKTI